MSSVVPPMSNFHNAQKTAVQGFSEEKGSRVSGVGDIGRGLMTADSDYDDSDNEDDSRSKPASQPVAAQQGKQGALYAAAVQLGAPPQRPEGARQPHTVQQPQRNVQTRPNQWVQPQQAEPSTPPGFESPRRQRIPPPAIQTGMAPVVAPAPAHSRPPQPVFMQPPPASPMVETIPGTPIPRTPQPLPPPQTPIVPVFVQPKDGATNVKFEEKVDILRGNSEETLLPRGRGGKADDFWRRFSMVAKEDARTNSARSAWLTKTQSGTTRLRAWVWIVGVGILLAIGASVGLGWYFTHNKPSSGFVAVGGSANETDVSTTAHATPTVPTVSVRPTKVTPAPVPTDLSGGSQKRDIDEEQYPPFPLTVFPTIPVAHRRQYTSNRIQHRRR